MDRSDLESLVIDSGSRARADEVITALVKALDGFACTKLQTATSAQVAMSTSLATQREAPSGFSVTGNVSFNRPTKTSSP